MKIAKKVIRFILELLLSIILIIYMLIQLLSSTVLNENYILSTFNQTGYYKDVYDLANSKFEEYLYQSGLDESVMDDILSEEKVKEDTVKIISNIYEGESQEISTQEIKDNLEKNIKESTGNKTLSASEQEAVDTFVNTVCEEYKAVISHTSYEATLNNALTKMSKYMGIAEIVLVVIAIVLVIILFALSIHHKYRFISDLGVALLSSGSVLVVSNLYIKFNIEVKNIIILNEAISKALVKIVQEILGTLSQYGIAFAIIGVLLIIIPHLVHNKRKYR